MDKTSGFLESNLAHMDKDILETNDNLTIINDNLGEFVDSKCSVNLDLSEKLLDTTEKNDLKDINDFVIINDNSQVNGNVKLIKDNSEEINDAEDSVNDILSEKFNFNGEIRDVSEDISQQNNSHIIKHCDEVNDNFNENKGNLGQNGIDNYLRNDRSQESAKNADSIEKNDNSLFIDNNLLKDDKLSKSNANMEQISLSHDNSSNEQSVSAIKHSSKENISLELNDDEPSNSFKENFAYQQKIIEDNSKTIKYLEEKCQNLEQFRKDLEIRLETAIRIKDSAVKEKENMVIRYAVGEKNVMKEKQQREQTDKKLKDTQKENEILQHKLQTMISEKSRICQMLDNKCYELKNCQQELDKTKECLSSLETKIKWSQNSLKSEIEAHKECQARNENLSKNLQEALDKIEQAKKDAEDSIKQFKTSQENKAFVLDQQVREQQASLILLRHEKTDRDQQVKNLQSELDRLQSKQKEMIQENNNLSQKVQQLERERLESEQKLSELRTCADQQRNDAANLQTKNVQLEQIKLQLKHEQDQLNSANEQIELLKQRNQELELDMEACRVREAELLLFTQQLTDKNVRLQSEFSAIEAKVQQLTTSETNLRRQLKERDTKNAILSSTLNEEKSALVIELDLVKNELENHKKSLEKTIRELEDQKGENLVVKRKYELSFREINRELHNCRKKLEQYESLEYSSSNASSNSPVNSVCHTEHYSDSEHPKTVHTEPDIDKQTLIAHIVKLQKASAKKSEKIDFLEEHVNTLVSELQKKTKLLSGYILREQSGTLTSNNMDKNKAKLAKLNGVMASLYGSKVTDDTLTLELSLDINRKLQAVLEDALLKNITLKENVDTLGNEIDRLNKLLK